MDLDEPIFTGGDQLAQKALAHVRAVCKGNGVKVDAVTVAAQDIRMLRLNAATYLELKPVTGERQTAGRIVAGMMTGSREEAMKLSDAAMQGLARNPAARAQIANLLLNRPDKGFGLSRHTIPVDFLKQEYTWHEGCSACRSTGHTSCQKCGGRRVETCYRCSGRGLMTCTLCSGAGIVNGERCTRCSGQRYIGCDICQRSGVISCRTCNGSGNMKCQSCGGAGWRSHIMSLTAQAATYFEYDRKSIPQGAADVIETEAVSLAANGDIKVKGRMADDREDVLGAAYEVEFPYGDIAFMVGKKQVKAHLFGQKADLHDFPNILDKMLAKPVEELRRAAADIGSVAQKIKDASRYRAIAMGFLVASKTTTQKTIAHLLKNYDIGMSHAMAEKIAVLADETTSRITRKPRYYGLALGLAITAALAGLYYLLPVRLTIAAYLPSQKIDFILDLLPLALGCALTTFSIQMMGASAIRTALGHLMKPGQEKSLVPKTRSSGKWGYAGVVLIMLGMIETAAHMGSAPYWYRMLREMFLRLTGF